MRRAEAGGRERPHERACRPGFRCLGGPVRSQIDESAVAGRLPGRRAHRVVEEDDLALRAGAQRLQLGEGMHLDDVALDPVGRRARASAERGHGELQSGDAFRGQKLGAFLAAHPVGNGGGLGVRGYAVLLELLQGPGHRGFRSGRASQPRSHRIGQVLQPRVRDAVAQGGSDDPLGERRRVGCGDEEENCERHCDILLAGGALWHGGGFLVPCGRPR